MRNENALYKSSSSAGSLGKGERERERVLRKLEYIEGATAATNGWVATTLTVVGDTQAFVVRRSPFTSIFSPLSPYYCYYYATVVLYLGDGPSLRTCWSSITRHSMTQCSRQSRSQSGVGGRKNRRRLSATGLGICGTRRWWRWRQEAAKEQARAKREKDETMNVPINHTKGRRAMDGGKRRASFSFSSCLQL